VGARLFGSILHMYKRIESFHAVPSLCSFPQRNAKVVAYVQLLPVFLDFDVAVIEFAIVGIEDFPAASFAPIFCKA